MRPAWRGVLVAFRSVRAARVALAATLLVSLVACRDGEATSTSEAPPTSDRAAGTAVVPTTPRPTTSPSTTAVDETAPVTSPSTPRDAATAVAPGYPSQPVDVPFPAADWPVAPLPPGVDGAALDSAVDAAMGAPDGGSGVRSTVVVQGGTIVYERYHPSVGPETVMSSYSVAKSFTSAIIGLLVDDGLLALDEPVVRPEWPAGDPRAAITLRQLLQMSSGLQWDEVSSLMTMGLTMLAAPSAAAIMARQPLEHEPGTTFEYSTGTSALVAGIAADAVGGCAELDAYLRDRLLDPIGVTSATITQDGGGCFVGGLGMDMTTRDFARFGLLHVRGGIWDGEQVLPTSWIDEARIPAPTDPRYGLHWWLGATGGEFAAVGLGGQQVAVFPSSDLVIVVNSTFGNDDAAGTLVGALASAFGARS